MKLVLPISLFLAIALAAGGADAKKPRRHKVKPGDSIAEIARFHGVEQDDLQELNGLGEDGRIHPGDVLEIPDVLVDGWTKGHIVKKGDTLARISRRYKVSIDDLREINRIGPKGRLQLGRRLVIPKGKRVDVEYEAAGEGAGGAKKTVKKVEKERWDGKATVVRVRGKSERKTMTMFDKRGRVRTYARRTISKLARSKKGKVRNLHPRLIRLIGKVAENYPGKDIEIISGFRPHKRGKKRSQHSKARALDFRVRGVSNLELYRYLKTFDKVGVGYYPNSTFVHLDVRDRKYTWTDVSGTGEAARYVKGGQPGSAEDTGGDHEAASDLEAHADAAEGEPDPENFDE